MLLVGAHIVFFFWCELGHSSTRWCCCDREEPNKTIRRDCTGFLKVVALVGVGFIEEMGNSIPSAQSALTLV